MQRHAIQYFHPRTRAERQATLSRFYRFDCGCRACREGWVTADLLGSTREGKVRGAVERVGELLGTGGWGAGCTQLGQAVKLLESNLAPPTREQHQLQVALWRALWVRSGNKKISKLF